MKKLKNLTMALSVFAFAIIFPSVVKADDATGVNALKSAIMFCDEVDAQNNVNCYLLGQIEGQGVFGVKSQISLSKLELTSVESGGSTFDAKETLFGEETCKEGAGNCYAFQAQSGKLINLAANDKNFGNVQSKNQGYTIIGKFNLKVKDEAATDCGKICVNVAQYAANENSQYVDTFAQGETSNTTNKRCEEVHLKGLVETEEKPEPEPEPKTCYTENGKYYGKDGTEVDEETYKKECVPETGSFASYAVLAAGAFIALSAITIAKKHNKFYRV